MDLNVMVKQVWERLSISRPTDDFAHAINILKKKIKPANKQAYFDYQIRYHIYNIGQRDGEHNLNYGEVLCKEENGKIEILKGHYPITVIDASKFIYRLI